MGYSSSTSPLPSVDWGYTPILSLQTVLLFADSTICQQLFTSSCQSTAQCLTRLCVDVLQVVALQHHSTCGALSDWPLELVALVKCI